MRFGKPTFLSFFPALSVSFPYPWGATPGGNNADVSIEVDPKIVEQLDVSPSNTASTDSQAPLQDPSHIPEGVQSTDLPSSPSDSEELAKSEEKLQESIHGLLEAAAAYYKSAHFTDITSATSRIVSATAAFRDKIQGTLDDQHISIDTFTKELEHIFSAIASGLAKGSSPDKTPDHAEGAGHAERVGMVDKILDDTAQALKKLAARYGIEEEVVSTYLLALKPQVQVLMAAISDINTRHPQLLPGLIFSVSTLLIPQSWILKPFLSVFGFGLAGPIKGSAAAWMQSYFWGPAVGAGSWFSWLQAAGMGVIPKGAWLVTNVPLFAGGLSATLLPSFLRR